MTFIRTSASVKRITVQCSQTHGAQLHVHNWGAWILVRQDKSWPTAARSMAVRPWAESMARDPCRAIFLLLCRHSRAAVCCRCRRCRCPEPSTWCSSLERCLSDRASVGFNTLTRPSETCDAATTKPCCLLAHARTCSRGRRHPFHVWTVGLSPISQSCVRHVAASCMHSCRWDQYVSPSTLQAGPPPRTAPRSPSYDHVRCETTQARVAETV